ncbi:hypothetical protein ACWERV_36000 [Streptomyces sp. NPDC004031]
MRPLRALPEFPAPPSAAAVPSPVGAPAGALPGGSPSDGCARGRRRLRCVIGLIGGVLWWGAVLGLAAGRAPVLPWLSAVAAGGWGLGLIPLHAVPAHVRRTRAARSRGDRSRAAPGAGEQA